MPTSFLSLRRAALGLSALWLALAACTPAATPDAGATSEAMHMAETESAMHMLETETAMEAEAMHMAETQEAMDAMQMAETESAMESEAMHMAETETAMDTEAMHMAETEEAMQAEETAMAPGTLHLALSGLEDLGEGWTYASWLVVDGEPLAVGDFTVDAEGMASVSEFSVPADTLAQATIVIVTIEPLPDPDPGPSMLYLLAGDFVGGEANLSTAHEMALEGGMTDTSGMATPAALPSIASMGPMGTASR
jgi:hypothetical protein